MPNHPSLGKGTSSRPVRLGAPALTVALLLAGCGDAPARQAAPPDTPTPVPPSTTTLAPTPDTAADPATRAAQLIATLTDEDLVGQVLMPYAYGNSATDVSASSAAGNRAIAGVDTPAEMIARYRLGGLILVGFSADDPTAGNQVTTNVENPAQVKRLTGGLRAAAGKLATGSAPLLIGTDQEYGLVTRIKEGVTTLPSAMTFGAAGNPTLTRDAWRVAGRELAALGINVDFAPVADVLVSRSTVIGSRSYGSDPDTVAAQIDGAVRGLQDAGVAATLKHFPGHGHTSADSHEGLPVVGQDRRTLQTTALPPFAAGIAAGTGLIMSSHLDVRAIDPGVPVTFSRKALVDVLRGELGYTGVVVTDAMNMPPAKRWPPGEAAVRALNAGNDLLLMPPDVAQAHRGLLAALRAGTLSRDRLVEAVTRVLTLKFRLAAVAPGPPVTLDSAEHRQVVRRIAAAAVTMLRGNCAAAPVRGPVTVTASGGREHTRAMLVDALRSAGVQVVARGGSVVHLVGYGDGEGDLRTGAAVTVAMDTPYVLAKAESPVLLATYSSSAASMSALADVLAGRARPQGRAPVRVPGLPASSCTG